VLVTGGFTRCCGDGASGSPDFNNLSVELFDPASAAWQLVVPADRGERATASRMRDYPHVFALPAPIAVDGVDYTVAVMNAPGRVLLMSPDPAVAADRRYRAPPNGQRPGASAEDATAALLGTGEILIVGGANVGDRADVYDPVRDTWRSVNLGIGRYTSAAVLLPDGTALLLNGWGGAGNERDWSTPQVLDPRGGQLRVERGSAWPAELPQRGYHSIALLLKDGRVLVGGGTAFNRDIGCEQPDLLIYEPPYFKKGPRPALAATAPKTLELSIGGAPVELAYDGGALAPPADGGVALMALGSFTHSFDQNQRYVRLGYEPRGSAVAITPPRTAAEAPPGDYILHLVSAAGVPSDGVHVRVR
jgi:hypothetical protein